MKEWRIVIGGNPKPDRKVYKAYNNIFKKYHDMGKEEVLQAEIAQSEEELRKLKEEL